MTVHLYRPKEEMFVSAFYEAIGEEMQKLINKGIVTRIPNIRWAYNFGILGTDVIMDGKTTRLSITSKDGEEEQRIITTRSTLSKLTSIEFERVDIKGENGRSN